jgi:hypothetical protein
MATPAPEPELEDDDEEMFKDSPTRKRRDSAVESEEDSMAKKVKTEVVEDAGVDGFVI